MKSTMRQQFDLVKAIKDESSTVQGLRMLREFLKRHGYEGSEDCLHYAIVRTTGACMSCGVSVATPNPISSDEAIAVLRERLES